MQLVECIPNFSEGRTPEVIQAIQRAFTSVPHVWVLHTDVGYDAHRTVFTVVGEISALKKATYRAILVARDLIDMSQHQGEHPRMGACDVCPFVPLGDTSVQSVIELTHQLGKELGQAGIPVFMYEKSASHPTRKNLAHIRKGEYESLVQRLQDSAWKPDYGPSDFQPTFGAMVLGARDFLIAYNVNLESQDVTIAQKIASTIRESNGGLSGVKAIGWWMEEHQRAQVSTNIVDIHQSGVKQVFDAVRAEAMKYDIEVITSELIGMIPLEVILKAGREISPQVQDEQTLIQTAFKYLGLEHLGEERIIEYQLQQRMN